jgi:hypothetical protein
MTFNLVKILVTIVGFVGTAKSEDTLQYRQERSLASEKDISRGK